MLYNIKQFQRGLTKISTLLLGEYHNSNTPNTVTIEIQEFIRQSNISLQYKRHSQMRAYCVRIWLCHLLTIRNKRT